MLGLPPLPLVPEVQRRELVCIRLQQPHTSSTSWLYALKPLKDRKTALCGGMQPAKTQEVLHLS